MCVIYCPLHYYYEDYSYAYYNRALRAPYLLPLWADTNIRILPESTAYINQAINNATPHLFSSLLPTSQAIQRVDFGFHGVKVSHDRHCRKRAKTSKA